jgi:hypothetical protein
MGNTAIAVGGEIEKAIRGLKRDAVAADARLIEAFNMGAVSRKVVELFYDLYIRTLLNWRLLSLKQMTDAGIHLKKLMETLAAVLESPILLSCSIPLEKHVVGEDMRFVIDPLVMTTEGTAVVKVGSRADLPVRLPPGHMHCFMEDGRMCFSLAWRQYSGLIVKLTFPKHDSVCVDSMFACLPPPSRREVRRERNLFSNPEGFGVEKGTRDSGKALDAKAPKRARNDLPDGRSKKVRFL